MILIRGNNLELSSAERTRVATTQPRVNAPRVEDVAALRQFPVTVAAANVRKAYGAVWRNLAVLLENGGGR